MCQLSQATRFRVPLDLHIGLELPKILLITPLLRWYIEHGLLVTKINQFIEFCPKRAFSPYEESVTNDKRAGDRDPAYKALADTSKLIGNSFMVIRL